MKKPRAQFECAILVDGRKAWKGKRPVKAYPRLRARHPRAKISIRWTLKEGTLIAIPKQRPNPNVLTQNQEPLSKAV